MIGATFRVIRAAELPEAVDPIIGDVTDEMARKVTADTPRDTGRLAAGWQVETSDTGQRVLSNDVEYARFVEYGTRYQHPAAMLGRAVASARARYGR